MPLYKITGWFLGDVYIAAVSYAHAEAYWNSLVKKSDDTDHPVQDAAPQKIEMIASQVFVELEPGETPRKGAAVAVPQLPQSVD